MENRIAIKRDILINAKRECVWTCMTHPDFIGKWWTPDQWKIPVMQVGALVKFGQDGEAAYAIIKVLDKPRQFTLHWRSTFPNAKQMTTFLLTEEEGGTRVTVMQTGFEALHDDIRQHWMDRIADGYTIILENLKAVHAQAVAAMGAMEGGEPAWSK
jgi:uncharacterized protein YndB with AHSA1/START domain